MRLPQFKVNIRLKPTIEHFLEKKKTNSVFFYGFWHDYGFQVSRKLYFHSLLYIETENFLEFYFKESKRYKPVHTFIHIFLFYYFFKNTYTLRTFFQASDWPAWLCCPLLVWSPWTACFYIVDGRKEKLFLKYPCTCGLGLREVLEWMHMTSLLKDF